MNPAAPMKDVTGRYLTRALFTELSDKSNWEQYPPLCTLKEAHDLYMAVADPTEYEFAKALLEREDTDFWFHWQRIVEVPDLQPILEKWRAELEVKLRSAAIRSIATSGLEPVKGVNAAKWIAEGGWKSKRSVGRPTKEQIKKERAVEEGIMSELDKDAERLGLTKH